MGSSSRNRPAARAFKTRKRFRDQLLGKKASGQIAISAGQVTCGELLDDLLVHYQSGGSRGETARVFRWCIDANVRPYFGELKAAALTTQKLKQYRDKRKADGVKEATCNRELSILRIAFNLGRKCTPPKVASVPYFPMVHEDNARQGFLSDDQYAKVRDALPDYVKPLVVTAYYTGVRLGELLAWRWDIRSLEAVIRNVARVRDQERAWPSGSDPRWRHANVARMVR
jgi:integrase